MNTNKSLKRSSLAQAVHALVVTLGGRLGGRGRTGQILAAILRRMARPILRRLGSGRTITAAVYGRTLEMPSEHTIALILSYLPQFNRPLFLLASAIATAELPGASLGVIDVGANIGETVAVIEQCTAAHWRFLCIEPDGRLATLCRKNCRSNPQVIVRQNFVGEAEGQLVRLEDDGSANPCTVGVSHANQPNALTGEIRRLDYVAAEFASEGRIILIKTDTEGYDFSVLRSAQGLLGRFHPSLYFEWYPRKLMQSGEDPASGFDYLQRNGYEYFVFFTNRAEFHCSQVRPDIQALRALASITGDEQSIVYFDVVATTSEHLFQQIVEQAIVAATQPTSTAAGRGTSASTASTALARQLQRSIPGWRASRRGRFQ